MAQRIVYTVPRCAAWALAILMSTTALPADHPCPPKVSDQSVIHGLGTGASNGVGSDIEPDADTNTPAVESVADRATLRNRAASSTSPTAGGREALPEPGRSDTDGERADGGAQAPAWARATTGVSPGDREALPIGGAGDSAPTPPEDDGSEPPERSAPPTTPPRWAQSAPPPSAGRTPPGDASAEARAAADAPFDPNRPYEFVAIVAGWKDELCEVQVSSTTSMRAQVIDFDRSELIVRQDGRDHHLRMMAGMDTAARAGTRSLIRSMLLRNEFIRFERDCGYIKTANLDRFGPGITQEAGAPPAERGGDYGERYTTCLYEICSECMDQILGEFYDAESEAECRQCERDRKAEIERCAQQKSRR